MASETGRSARALAGEAGARRVNPSDLPAGADVLVVATPSPSHLELATRGVRAGATVLVESPWWTDLAQADTAVEVDRIGPGRLRGAANLRSSPLWRRARSERTALGRVRHLSGAIHQPLPDWGHLAAEAAAPNPFERLGSTAVPLALDLVGAVWPVVDSVRAERSGPQGWIELATEGLVVHLDLAFTDPANVWFQAASDDGVLRVEFSPAPGLERDGDPVEVGRSADPLAATGYVDQLARLGTDEDLTLDPQQIRTVVALLDAAQQSADRGGQSIAVGPG